MPTAEEVPKLLCHTQRANNAFLSDFWSACGRDAALASIRTSLKVKKDKEKVATDVRPGDSPEELFANKM